MRSCKQCPPPSGPVTASDRLVLRYRLQHAGEATIILHDLLGRMVRTVPAGYRGAGEGMIDLDLRDLANGNYIVGMRIGDMIRATAPVVIRR